MSNNNQTVFFSSVRTKSDIKKQAQTILEEMWLSWWAFVNNAAKQLITEKRVIFDTWETKLFSNKKKKELKQAIAKAKTSKWVVKQMNLNEAKIFLRWIK